MKKILLFNSTPASANIVFITGGFAGTTGTTATTAAINATGANLIIVGVTRQAAQTATVTDSQSNTYTKDDTQSNIAGVDIWRCYTTNVTSSMTITATGTGTATALYYFIFSGSVGTTVDNHNGIVGSGTTTTAGTSAITPSVNGAVFIAVVNDFNASAPTINSSFIIPSGCSNTLINTGSVLAYAGAMAYYIQPTATSLNPTWNFGSSIGFSSILADYK